MPLTDEQLNTIKAEFLGSPDNQELEIDPNEEDDFWSWFKENAEEFSANHDINFEQDSSIQPGRCFGNSQTIAYLESKEYCEGFMSYRDTMVYHGFNVTENSVEDSTILNNPSSFEDQNNQLPQRYYGVRIPLDFIEENRCEEIEEQHLNISPLLYDYYLSNKEG